MVLEVHHKLALGLVLVLESALELVLVLAQEILRSTCGSKTSHHCQSSRSLTQPNRRYR